MERAIADRDYTSRRGELSAYGRAVNAQKTVKWLLVGLTVAIVLIAACVLLLPNVVTREAALLVICVIAVAGGLTLWRVIKAQLIEPELATRKWIQQICDGELRSTIELPPDHSHYKELDFHTRNVGTLLRQLSDEMETLVDSQTRRLESQNRVLELLFRLTSDVAHEIDQQSVFETVCHSLAVGAYMKVDESLQLQAASHSSAFTAEYDLSALVDEVVLEKNGLRIPILRGNDPMGVLLVISDDHEQLQRRSSQQVFKTLSEQLSMFVARQYVLESVQQARLVKERSMLGAEIHDSLAQTLLACRYQVRMLREQLEQNPAAPVLKDLLRVEGTIDEANVEVRELIGQTRQATEEQPYADSIQGIIEEHNRAGGIPVFFQNDNPHVDASAREASVVQRIVREALINANKYSNATAIRVYLHIDHAGVRSLLIEDDGDGFNLSTVESVHDSSHDAIGDHIGLSIMRDRALSIGAILDIDSEPGEGTRISLKLPPITLPGAL
jgi:two-component system nitrate/nitrite sensor histidine kinase NarX